MISARIEAINNKKPREIISEENKSFWFINGERRISWSKVPPSNNPVVDSIRAYTIGNLTTSIGFSDSLAVDFMVLNITDEAGVNSSMTDVFGVAATGLELIPPRQIMTRLRYSF